MNKKRNLAMLLSMVLALGATLTVFAEGTKIDDPSAAAAGQEVTVDSDIDLPVIDVTVPTSVSLLLNPYQISYAEEIEEDVVEAKDQVGPSSIISVPGTITNASNVPIGVNATVSATTPTTDFTLATAPIKTADKTKTAFIMLTVAETEEDLQAAMVGPEVKATSTAPTGKNQLIIGKTAITKKDMVVLDAGNKEATTALFTFSGNMCTTLEKGSWTSTDKVTVSLKFSFTPKQYVAPEPEVEDEP